MKEINPEHIRQVIELHNSDPFIDLLDIKIVSLDDGMSKIELKIRKQLPKVQTEKFWRMLLLHFLWLEKNSLSDKRSQL